MAAQRIVLTSPWKLGLFVFMLVAGTGFGLIWAYIELLGGQIDLKDEKVLQTAYIVLGAVAALGLAGYLAVVTSARPLDRVVRNSRNREQLLKRFGKIQDPRMIEIDDYEEEPALKAVLERWSEQAAAASDARLSNASNSEALVQLTSQIRESGASEFQPELQESTPDLDALVDAIKDFASSAGSEMGQDAEQDNDQSALSRPIDLSGSATPVVDKSWKNERSTWHAAAEQLFRCEQELEGFVLSVSEHASEIAARTGNLSRNSGALPRGAAMAMENLRRNATRMGKLQEASQLLAEQANKLANAISVNLARGGKPAELKSVGDGLQTLAAQYQRIAAEVGTAHDEQQDALDKLTNLEMSRLDSSAANALEQQAMALDQHAGALGELLVRFRNPMEQIRGLDPSLAEAAARSKQAAQQAAQQDAPQDAPQDAGSGRVYEMAELGGRELAAEAGADAADRVYDLDELGAVEL